MNFNNQLFLLLTLFSVLFLSGITTKHKDKQTCSSFFLLLIKGLIRNSKLIISGERVFQAEASHHHHHHHRRRPTKLFVFGDSYADTGNIQKGVSNSWKDPYGITFPGKPAGRFSDGRVLTDYIGM